MKQAARAPTKTFRITKRRTSSTRIQSRIKQTMASITERPNKGVSVGEFRRGRTPARLPSVRYFTTGGARLPEEVACVGPLDGLR